jgi:hypothetical protein
MLEKSEKWGFVFFEKNNFLELLQLVVKQSSQKVHLTFYDKNSFFDFHKKPPHTTRQNKTCFSRKVTFSCFTRKVRIVVQGGPKA